MNKGFLLRLALAISALSLVLGACADASIVKKGTVQGRVLIGPICPVERVPPDPACAPRGYKSTIKVLSLKSGNLRDTVKTNATGVFTVTLPVGSYVFSAKGGSVFPRCTDKTVKVLAGKKVEVILNCDSGIR